MKKLFKSLSRLTGRPKKRINAYDLYRLGLGEWYQWKCKIRIFDGTDAMWRQIWHEKDKKWEASVSSLADCDNSDL